MQAPTPISALLLIGTHTLNTLGEYSSTR